jgi:hypothetical protein
MPDNPTPFAPEKIRFLDFKLLKGQVDAPEAFTLTDVDGYRLDNELQLGFSFGDLLVKADYTCQIHTESNGKNPQEATGEFHLVFIYKVDNLPDLAKPNSTTQLELDPQLANALASVSYSTARGILLTRLQGTALQNFVLPIINPNGLIKGYPG